jgi:Uncharacterized protein conserved in bacteria
MTSPDDLAGLLCARICHDLVSPIGAVGNGIELISPAGGVGAEEHALLEDSAAAARAALRFLRLAFGAASDDAPAVPDAELRALADDHLCRGRHEITWPIGGAELPRPLARMLCLALMTAVSATPLGARMMVAAPRSAPLSLTVEAEGRRAELSPEALDAVETAAARSPREAHIALLSRLARSRGARLSVAAEGAHARVAVSEGG